jgi:hypothetical protein
MRILTELQSKWRCPKHSKDQDIYCYSVDGSVCLTLTHGNLSFWALEIVRHLPKHKVLINIDMINRWRVKV